MRSHPILVRTTLYNEDMEYFQSNMTHTIVRCRLLSLSKTHKVVLYRLRLFFKPTKKIMFITFQNELQVYEPPHVSTEDILICLNADLLWWHEGFWIHHGDKTKQQTFQQYKHCYTKYVSPICLLSEYVLYKNEVIALKKFFEKDYDAFYYLPL